MLRMSSSVMSRASSHKYCGTRRSKTSLATYSSLPRGTATMTSSAPKATAAGPLWGPAPGRPTVPAEIARERQTAESRAKTVVKSIQPILARVSGTVTGTGWETSVSSASITSATEEASALSESCSSSGFGGRTFTVTTRASPVPSARRESPACKKSPCSGPASLAQSAMWPRWTTTLDVGRLARVSAASIRCTLFSIRSAEGRPTARLTFAFCSTAGACRST
mmetsp:Transcript_27282/g.75051  ORF Transcript_27282/g.75051 Transcript_27282/m.75051 type:complete len:223 (+) Transcript_27282:259-927(+)